MLHRGGTARRATGKGFGGTNGFECRGYERREVSSHQSPARKYKVIALIYPARLDPQAAALLGLAVPERLLLTAG